MASNTSVWPSHKSRLGRSARAFTLTELLIALGLSGILLTAILTTFVFIGKSGNRLMHYRDIETRAALAMQQFAMDARQASSVSWTDSRTLIMQVPDAGAVRYSYDATKGTLVRTASSKDRVLAEDINTFRFVAFDRDGVALSFSAGNINTRTKMVQLEIGFKSRSKTITPVESDVISARYMLRNKTSI